MQTSSTDVPRRVCVLIVDDDRDIRETLVDLLTDEGYAVAEAADGVDAMETLLSSAEPMVVLLDLIMPRLNGFDVLSLVTENDQLRGRHAFIVMTANKAAADSPSAVDPYFATLLQRHAIPIIAKPCGVDELLLQVRQAARQVAQAPAE